MLARNVIVLIVTLLMGSTLLTGCKGKDEGKRRRDKNQGEDVWDKDRDGKDHDGEALDNDHDGAVRNKDHKEGPHHDDESWDRVHDKYRDHDEAEAWDKENERDGKWMCDCDFNITNGTHSWALHVNETDAQEDAQWVNFTKEWEADKSHENFTKKWEDETHHGDFADEWEAAHPCACGSASGHWRFVGQHGHEGPPRGGRKGGRKHRGGDKSNTGVMVAIFAGGSLCGGMSILLLLACWRCCRRAQVSQKSVPGQPPINNANVIVGVPTTGTADFETGTIKGNAVCPV